VENGIPALKLGGGIENGGGGFVKSISTAGFFALNSKGVLGVELEKRVIKTLKWLFFYLGRTAGALTSRRITGGGGLSRGFFEDSKESVDPIEGILVGRFEVGGAILKPDDPAFSFEDE